MKNVIQSLQASLQRDGEILLTIRVHPAARKTAIKEMMHDGTIKIDIAAAPEDGKANLELADVLAKHFEVPRANVEIVVGVHSKRKTVRIHRR